MDLALPSGKETGNMKKLTPKQERFVQEYLATGNASEAYRRAYDAENMSSAVISVKACELPSVVRGEEEQAKFSVD